MIRAEQTTSGGRVEFKQADTLALAAERRRTFASSLWPNGPAESEKGAKKGGEK